MALRTRYSSLDMVRMAKFAKENPELKPIPLIKAYCKKYPEVTEEQKLKNIRNWLNDNIVMAVSEDLNGIHLCDESDLVEIKASINSLILSPKASVQRCKELYKQWMKETFNKVI